MIYTENKKHTNILSGMFFYNATSAFHSAIKRTNLYIIQDFCIFLLMDYTI